MAIDGTGILESDLAHDIYNTILDFYDSGLNYEEIESQLNDYNELMTADLFAEIIYTSKTKAYYEIGFLKDDLIEQISILIQEQRSLKRWQKEFSSKEYEERIKVLNRFIRAIRKPKNKIRERKKYSTIKKKLFLIGDCISFETEENLFHGIICEISEYRGNCDYAIMIIALGGTKFPKSFTRGNFYGHKISSSFEPCGYILGAHVIIPSHRMIIKENIDFKIIGNIRLKPKKYMIGSFGGVLSKKDVINDFIRIPKNITMRGTDLFPVKKIM